MNGFYVTIPSNTRVTGNTASHFRATLPHQLDLKGRWEVALVEIQYPHSWFNVRVESKAGNKFEHTFSVMRKYTEEETAKSGMKSERHVLNIIDGSYNTAADLCDALNTVTQKELNLPMMFTTNERLRGKVYFKKPEHVSGVELSETFAYMLGFTSPLLTNSQMAKGMPDMRNGIDTLWVYCSIIEEQIVGDTMEPLLQTVAVSGQ